MTLHFNHHIDDPFSNEEVLVTVEAEYVPAQNVIFHANDGEHATVVSPETPEQVSILSVSHGMRDIQRYCHKPDLAAMKAKAIEIGRGKRTGLQNNDGRLSNE